MDPETVSVRATTEAGDPAVRRRRLAVAGVSLMGAAAVSTAVFQTVTGTSTSLAMPDLASVLAGTASFPTPQGPAASAVPVSAPAITDLGVPTSTAADPTTPQVDLRANRGPLPDPASRPGPVASPLAGVAPSRPSTGSTPSGSGSAGDGSTGSGSTGSAPARPGSTDGRDHGGGRHGGRGGSAGPTTPGTTTPGTTPPGTTPPASTTPGTTTPRSTTPSKPPTSPPGPTSPSPPSTPSVQVPPPSSAPASGA